MFGARLAAGVSITLCTLLVLGGCATASRSASSPEVVAAQPESASPPVRILLVNDVYVTDTLRDGSGGLARVAAWRDSVQRATGERVLFMLAGDVFSPSLLSKWFSGRHMVEAFNAAELDYATLGNHEFDVSREEFTKRLDESRFQWLSANCGYGDGTAFRNVRGWDTVTVGNTQVGIFGTTVLAEYRSWVRCSDPDVAGRAAVDTLKALGVDLVIGLTHRFIFEDSATLVNDPRATLLLGGHEHDGRRIEKDGRLLVKAASNARSAVYVEAQLPGGDAAAGSATASAGRWLLSDTVLRPSRDWSEQAEVARVNAAWRDTLTARIGADRLLGRAPQAIDAVDSTLRSREARFGNLVADAYRLGTQADVALINSGAMRLDDMIGPGEIGAHLVESVFLFADETRVVTFEVTGARLRELLEHGVSLGRLGTGAYPQVSGVRFTFDPRLPSGRRIIGPLRRDDGREIAADDRLRMSFPSYPSCLSGDGYVIPEAKSACAALDANVTSAPRSADLVIRHLERMQRAIVAPPVGRVVRVP